MAKDVSRAADIIDRIRSLYTRGVQSRQLVDVNETIEQMIVLVQDETGRYSISIHTDLAQDLPKVMADRVQVQQVLMNLMLNGIEEMQDVRSPRELAISSRPEENGHVRVSISDSRVGLPGEAADQIFKAFFTTKPKGTGMGLAISRSIIESHGGLLWASANSERGATFHFTLSIHVAPSPPPVG
jgi:C4-dicarboxylate-specific signal transduction histidine kinase